MNIIPIVIVGNSLSRVSGAIHMLRVSHNASYGFFIASIGIGFSLTMVTTSESSYELPSALADGMELVIKLELASRIEWHKINYNPTLNLSMIIV